MDPDGAMKILPAFLARFLFAAMLMVIRNRFGLKIC